MLLGLVLLMYFPFPSLILFFQSPSYKLPTGDVSLPLPTLLPFLNKPVYVLPSSVTKVPFPLIQLPSRQIFKYVDLSALASLNSIFFRCLVTINWIVSGEFFMLFAKAREF